MHCVIRSGWIEIHIIPAESKFHDLREFYKWLVEANVKTFSFMLHFALIMEKDIYLLTKIFNVIDYNLSKHKVRITSTRSINCLNIEKLPFVLANREMIDSPPSFYGLMFGLHAFCRFLILFHKNPPSQLNFIILHASLRFTVSHPFQGRQSHSRE